MNDSQPTDPRAEGLRPPPRIIHVPPPHFTWHQSLAFGLIVCWVMLIWAVFFAFELAHRLPVADWLANDDMQFVLGIASVGIVLGLAVFATFEWWRRNVNLRHKDFFQRHPAAEQDPASVALTPLIRKTTFAVSARKARRVIAAHPVVSKSGACIVSVGNMEVPEPAPHRFEPLVFPPAKSNLVLIPMAGFYALLALLAYVSEIVRQSAFDLHVWLPIAFLASLGLLFAGMFAWRVALFPRYIRVAPGTVQFLRFRIGSRRPNVVSFPMDSETFVLAMRQYQGKKAPVRFRFLRGNVCRSMNVRNTRKNPEQLKHVWQAILSTAPTPPMSRESLVG